MLLANIYLLDYQYFSKGVQAFTVTQQRKMQISMFFLVHYVGRYNTISKFVLIISGSDISTRLYFSHD